MIRDFPNVRVRDQAESKQEQSRQIDQVLVLFHILLVLAVVIAFIGIVNTLALWVLERGWTQVRALRGQGITELAVPVGTLALFVVAAALAGILAAIFLGRRAAKIEILRAVTSE